VTARQVLDPTGAGDAYRAGLLKGLTLSLPWLQAARLGAVVASFAVEQQGTQEHRVSLAEVQERYRAAFEEAVF
jgi:adenosine kinase